MLNDSPKNGIYFSSDPIPPAFKSIEGSIALKHISSLANLKSQLHSDICDFLILDVEDTVQFLKIIQAVFKMDRELILMTVRDLDFPPIKSLHRIRTERMVEDLMEVLSFEMARSNNQLQTVYSEFVERGHDHFYLTEHSPMGIVLTDEEDSIFYVNEAAKMLLNYDESRKLLQQNLMLESFRETLMQDGISSFDQVAVKGSKTFVSLIIKQIRSGNDKVGAIAFIDDVTDVHESSIRLEREKVKFEKLTGRLNDLILKDADTRIYNESYMRRKLDLEIRHSHRMQSDFGICLFYIKQYDKLFASSSQLKSFQSKMADLMADKFSESFVVGVLAPGVWVAIGAHILNEKDLDLTVFLKQLHTQLADEVSKKSHFKIETKLIDNLTQFETADDLLQVIG